MIQRKIEEKILKYAKQYPVIVLTGPRQSGKTTLVKKLFSDFKYVNLEDLELRSFAENDPKGFLNQFGYNLIIDEIQRVPELFSYIQLRVDEKKDNGMYILTGSQNFLLLEKVNQSLSGRAVILKLLPFSIKELKNADIIKKNSDLTEFIFKGFYPKLYDQKVDVDQYYLSYIQTYIERDVRLIKNISNLNQFHRFLTLISARVGQILNVVSLANDCGISQKTASDWLSILEASYIIFFLQPHYKNYNKRVTKMPKIYFYDIGIACSLLGISNVNQLKSHFLIGNLFESFVVADFLKQQYNLAKRNNLFFWRDKMGNEVDLIIDEVNEVVPIEIKFGQTISDDYFKGLMFYNRIAERNTENSFVIYGGNERQLNKDGKVFSWRDLDEVLES